MSNPFRYLNSSPEVIRLVAMMYVSMVHAPRSFYPIANGGEPAILFASYSSISPSAGGGPWSVDRAVLKQD
jgi:putative oxidoreductase